MLHCGLITSSVRLRPRPLNSRPLFAVQQTKLNAGNVRRYAHDAIERVNFADEVPFTKATNRGVARHHTDGIKAQRD